MSGKLSHEAATLSTSILHNQLTCPCRAIESSLVPLLRWGSASIETSVDQPALPHVIVALNAVDVHVHSGKWGLKEVTDRILDLANESLKHPFISELAAERRQSGVRIETIRDLLHSYYSSFTVVMIPEKSNYNILYDQISILSHCIDRCREMSHEAKRETRMLSKSGSGRMRIHRTWQGRVRQ